MRTRNENDRHGDGGNGHALTGLLLLQVDAADGKCAGKDDVAADNLVAVKGVDLNSAHGRHDRQDDAANP